MHYSMNDTPTNTTNPDTAQQSGRIAPPPASPITESPATTPSAELPTEHTVSYAPKNMQKSVGSWMFIKIAGVIFAVFFVAVAILYVHSLSPSQMSVTPTPTPQPLPTPTPIRTPSRISTSSAFMNFQGAVASLSASLNGFDVSDTTLTPPVLVTDLGLTP